MEFYAEDFAEPPLILTDGFDFGQEEIWGMLPVTGLEVYRGGRMDERGDCGNGKKNSFSNFSAGNQASLWKINTH